MAIEIRPASRNDEDAVFRLLPQLYGDQVKSWDEARVVFRELTSSDRGCVLVAVEDGIVLGVISASFNPAIRYGGNYAQVEDLVVDEAARGKQAGAALVRAIIDEARQRGCREIGLYPLHGNRPFYEKFGFTYAGDELRQRLD
jgi:predicted N-acetyltransferase YhbS